MNEWMRVHLHQLLYKEGNTLSSDTGLLKLGPVPGTQMWDVTKHLLKPAESSPFCFQFARGRAWWTSPLTRRLDIKPPKREGLALLCNQYIFLTHWWLLGCYQWILVSGWGLLSLGMHHELVKVTVVLLCLRQLLRTNTFLKMGKRPASCLSEWGMKETTLKSIRPEAISWKVVQ